MRVQHVCQPPRPPLPPALPSPSGRSPQPLGITVSRQKGRAFESFAAFGAPARTCGLIGKTFPSYRPGEAQLLTWCVRTNSVRRQPIYSLVVSVRPLFSPSPLVADGGDPLAGGRMRFASGGRQAPVFLPFLPSRRSFSAVPPRCRECGAPAPSRRDKAPASSGTQQSQPASEARGDRAFFFSRQPRTWTGKEKAGFPRLLIPNFCGYHYAECIR